MPALRSPLFSVRSEYSRHLCESYIDLESKARRLRLPELATTAAASRSQLETRTRSIDDVPLIALLKLSKLAKAFEHAVAMGLPNDEAAQEALTTVLIVEHPRTFRKLLETRLKSQVFAKTVADPDGNDPLALFLELPSVLRSGLRRSNVDALFDSIALWLHDSAAIKEEVRRRRRVGLAIWSAAGVATIVAIGVAFTVFNMRGPVPSPRQTVSSPPSVVSPVDRPTEAASPPSPPVTNDAPTHDDTSEKELRALVAQIETADPDLRELSDRASSGAARYKTPQWRALATRAEQANTLERTARELTIEAVDKYVSLALFARLRNRLLRERTVAIAAPRDLEKWRNAGASDQLLALLGPPSAPSTGTTWTAHTDDRLMVWVSFEINEASGVWVDGTEVTKAQFREFTARETNWQKTSRAGVIDYLKKWKDDSTFDGDPREPVVNVDFAAAAAFCSWAGKQLPTLTEWRRAAELAGRPGIEHDGVRAVGPTDQAERSGALALYNMLDNVSEWTSSEDSAGNRIVAGSNHTYPRETRRVGFSQSVKASITDGATGFRCAYVPEQGGSR